MYYLNDFCCVCFCNNNLQPLLSSSNDNITYYVKLTSTMPDMCLPEISYQGLLCKQCCDNTDLIYAFRQKCLRSKIILTDYISQLKPSTYVDGYVTVSLIDLKQYMKPEEIYIKTEYESSDNINMQNDINDEQVIDNMKIEKNASYNSQDIKDSIEVTSDYNTNESIFVLYSEDDKVIDTSSITIKEEIVMKIENENFEVINNDTESNSSNETLEPISNSGISMTIHTEKKTHKCSLCNAVFTRSYNLKRHMRIHSGEKPHECSVCFKRFSESSRLSVHMRYHSGEKSYQCNICNKSFLMTYNLTKHMRCHTGEKPFECKICNKRFTISSNLTKHMRIHSGEKPYECNICNKKFINPFTLNRHVNTHTKCSQIQ